MLIMPDIEEPFVPLSEGLFVDPYEAKSNITALLSQLPALFSQVKNPEPALLPTLNAALAALEKTGGKIVCSLAALPTWGPGRLFLRDDGKQHGGDAEKKLFNTEHPGWRKAGDKMVQAGVGIDFFLAAPGGGYLDIATVGEFYSALLSMIAKSCRSRLSFHWRRNLLLSQLHITTRHRKAVK
jgi:protein transport protein SEC24